MIIFFFNEVFLSKSKILNTELLISKFKKVHGNNFDYSKVIFDGLTSKVIIICTEHGEFLQQPRLHLRGSNGCKVCNYLKKKRR